MRLYEIADEIARLDLSEFIDDNGEIVDEFSLNLTTEMLNSLQMDKTKKILDIACLIKSKRAENDARKIEISKQQKRIKSNENSVDWLIEYVKNNSEPLEKFSDSRASISYRKSESVVVGSVYDLPGQYVRRKTIAEPMKAEIKKAIKDGESVHGASLQENQNMVIK